jgi:hypothetical protein
MSLLNGLINGPVRLPDSAINYGNKPLPMFPPGALQFSTPDGRFVDSGSLLPGGLANPYSYGTSARISTQTQLAFPNTVALIIPKIYIPSPESDNFSNSNPVLEHSISDGDLVFCLNMGPEMASYGSNYFKAPYGYSAKCVPLINLATVNYILWGLQVGLRREKSLEWKKFFSKLTKANIQKYPNELTMETVWNFVQTYIRPFAIMHGSDSQGGQHEGNTNNIVTHAAVDYVSSFAIEGKLMHVNNLWRDFDVHENDDLILGLRKMDAPHADVNFNLSSSVQAFRAERAPISNAWYFLRPEVSQFRSFSDIPYIHIGRSQKYCSMYSRGRDLCCWDSRMCVVPGAPLQMTFEPGYMDGDILYSKKWGLDVAEEDKEGTGLVLNLKPPEDPLVIEAPKLPHARTSTVAAAAAAAAAAKAAAATAATGSGMPTTTTFSDSAAAKGGSNKKQKTGSTSSKMASVMQAFGTVLASVDNVATSP